jgi:microsomal dipeptidase-like Zn-dependent dipeptidase
MRVGRWTREMEYGEGSAQHAGFPPQPDWFHDNLGLGTIRTGLRDAGFAAAEVDQIMGLNWLRFFDQSFGPAS